MFLDPPRPLFFFKNFIYRGNTNNKNSSTNQHKRIYVSEFINLDGGDLMPSNYTSYKKSLVDSYQQHKVNPICFAQLLLESLTFTPSCVPPPICSCATFFAYHRKFIQAQSGKKVFLRLFRSLTSHLTLHSRRGSQSNNLQNDVDDDFRRIRLAFWVNYVRIYPR